MLPVALPQNGHSKSPYSTSVSGASTGPRMWSRVRVDRAEQVAAGRHRAHRRTQPAVDRKIDPAEHEREHRGGEHADAA